MALTDAEKRAADRATAFAEFQNAVDRLDGAKDDHAEATRAESRASNAHNDARAKYKGAKARLDKLLPSIDR